MKKTSNLALAALLLSVALFATQKASAQDLIMRRTNSVGNWFTRIANDGTFFNNDDTNRPVHPGGYWQNPNGGIDTLVFGGGIWVGAKRRVAGVLSPAVSFSYEPNGATDQFFPGSTIYDGLFRDSSSGGRDKYRVYRSNDQVGPLWPMRITANGPAYIDDPALRASAGPPYVIGDEDLFAIYKDSDPARRSTKNVLAAGVEIRSQLAFWRKGHGADVIIVKNTVIHTTQDTLFDPVVGLALDGDINLPSDDRLKGFRNEAVSGAVFFTANSRTDPFLGVLLLSGQHNSRRSDPGLSTLKYWDIREDPQSDSERFAFLTSGKLDTALSVIGDARLLMASASHEPLVGMDTLYFDYALYAVPSLGLPALSPSDSTRLLHVAEEISNDYYLGRLGQLSVAGPAAALAGGISVYPNPSHGWVRVTVGDQGRREVGLFDVLGREVRHAISGSGEAVLELSGLATGTYVVRISGSGSGKIVEFVQ